MIAVDTNLLAFAHRQESRGSSRRGANRGRPRVLSETEDFLAVLERFVRRPRVRGPVVHDARVAALCVAHGAVELLTVDRDFALFPELHTRDPLRTAPG
jgi:predicted nucleic acid-binding protein